MDPNETPTPDTPTESVEAAALEAMDAGIAAETPEVPTAADPPIPGTPEALAAEQEAERVAAEQAAADAAAQPEKDAEVENEITSLKLGEKAGERFRNMAAEIKTLAPIKEALEKAGVKDAEQLAGFLKRNEAMTAVMDMVKDTGASTEQFSQTLDYLSLVSAAGSGDRKAAERAFELVTSERNELAKALGIEVDGFDPLAEFPDLQDEVEGGEITRARAVEVAQQRRDAAFRAQNAERQANEGRQQAEQAAAIQSGRDALNALEAELVADPTYAGKKAAFYAEVQQICRENPPSSWQQLARYAYRGIAAPAPTKPPPGPMRSGNLRPAVMPVTDDPAQALEFGIANP